jgi:hypothetical protein
VRHLKQRPVVARWKAQRASGGGWFECAPSWRLGGRSRRSSRQHSWPFWHPPLALRRPTGVHPSSSVAGRSCRRGMDLLRHVECPQRSAGERLCPLAPIWANYVLVGLRRPLGPWVGSAVDAHVRIADIPPFLRGDLPPSRSQRETSTQSFKILPSGESFSHASPFHQAL